MSISWGDSVDAELREKKVRLGMGIPWPALLAYNLFNSQWYIQWLRTLRNRGAERLPKDRKAGQRRSSLAGFFHIEKNLDAMGREAHNPRNSQWYSND